jgi:replicative DNA helicase
MGYISAGLIDQSEPPMNLEVEAALLGAILRRPEMIETIEGKVSPRDFGSPEHGRIFEIAVNLFNRGADIGPGRLAHIVEAHPELKEVGGHGYLMELVANVVSVINAPDYAETIAELATRRDLMGFSDDLHLLAADTSDEQVTREELLDRAEERFTNVILREDLDRSRLQSATNLAASGLEMFLHEYEHGINRGLATGFAALDEILRGLFPSDLVIVAGRPSMGKSAFGLALAMAAERNGKRSAIFSPEMDSSQIIERIVAQHSDVPGNRIRDRDVYEDELPKIVEAYRMAQSDRIWIDESAALTVPAIRREARRLKRRGGLDLVVVDYLQLMSGSETARRGGRVAEISEITRGLKILAKELGVPIVLLSQLNRKVEEREDKRPNLADLRDSGSIEQDADVVTFLYRPEYYLREPEQRQDEAESAYLERMADYDAYREKVRGVAEVLVAKNRHGPTETATLHFEPQTGRFSE